MWSRYDAFVYGYASELGKTLRLLHFLSKKERIIYALLHIKKGEQLYACYYIRFASNLPAALLQLVDTKQRRVVDGV